MSIEQSEQPVELNSERPDLTSVHLHDGAIDRIAGLARQAAGVDVIFIEAPAGSTGIPSRVPVGVLHNERPKVVDLRPYVEKWRHTPERKVGTAQTFTLQSFVELVKHHATENTVIFADTAWRAPSFTAVIDYHEPALHDERGARADFCRHRIHYAFPLSDAWKLWVENHGKAKDQGEFASFIEDNIADLSSPADGERQEFEALFGTRIATPAELIQLSRGLQVYAGVKVKNALTLQSGESTVQFEEEHRDADGKPLKVPGLFILQVPLFAQGDVVRLPVRLRYRMAGGSLQWSYHLYRPDVFVTDRVRADLGIVGRDTALRCFEGKPEA